MAYQALGFSVGTAAAAASDLLSDPGFTEAACHVRRLGKMAKGKDPGSPCPPRAYSAADKSRGVGLARYMPGIRAAVWGREHPIATIAIGVGVIGLFIGAGYYLGKTAK